MVRTNAKASLIKQLRTDLEVEKNSRKYTENMLASIQIEKNHYYSEVNQYKTRVARLENTVTSLKEAAQKTLQAFDTMS